MKIFISHSSKNKKFARRLAGDLRELGYDPWLDAWKITVGQSITQEIERGLSGCDFVVLVLSPAAVQSGWVEREWQAKFGDEIKKQKIFILPILLKPCEIPTLLKDRKFANFKSNYQAGFKELSAAFPILRPSSTTLPKDRNAEKVSSLISELHAKAHPLSKHIADALHLAQGIRDSSLEKFCRKELSGYVDNVPAYRLIDAFVGLDEINFQYWGWNRSPAAILAFLESQTKNWARKKWAITMSVSKVEATIPTSADVARFGIIKWQRKIRDFFPDSETPDKPVFCYASGDAFARIIASVRNELTQLLLQKLPPVSSGDPKSVALD